MIDAHYHLEAAQRPAEVADAIESGKVLTVAVTSLPSVYSAMRPWLRAFRYIRPALGLHPLLIGTHEHELDHFLALARNTTFIGEVGLDFSAEGAATCTRQTAVLRAIFRALPPSGKFVSVHSRKAEAAVLELATEENAGSLVFHWYSGGVTVLDRVLHAGHYLSVNPAMLASANGRRIVSRIPPDRLLTETDGPYTRMAGGPTVPADVRVVIEYAAANWSFSKQDAEMRIASTFRRIVCGEVD